MVDSHLKVRQLNPDLVHEPSTALPKRSGHITAGSNTYINAHARRGNRHAYMSLACYLGLQGNFKPGSQGRFVIIMPL